MIIELRGVEFNNKGAELMLFAILEKVKQRFPETIFVMETTSITPINKQREVGILSKFEYEKLKRRGLSIAKFGFLVPKSIRRRFGLILESEIEVVLDGSGFGYGDYWGAEKAGERLSNIIETWKKSGKKIILLPQAFGKFEDKKLQIEMRRIIKNADLIFARDTYSLSYLHGIIDRSNNIFLKPDFTNLISGKLPSYFDKDLMQVAIVPNNKLVESGVFKIKSDYVTFLNRVVEAVKSQGFSPYFLIHEGKKDLALAEEANKTFEQSTKIVIEPDSLAVKGLIGNSLAVITSRFHGLVSALAQGVPCLCVGWSHKYLALMQDYKFAEGLLSEADFEGERLNSKISMILDEKSAANIRKSLKTESSIQKELTEEMWKQVFEVLA